LTPAIILSGGVGLATAAFGLWIEPTLLGIRLRASGSNTTGNAKTAPSPPALRRNHVELGLLILALGIVMGLLTWRYGWNGSHTKIVLALIYSAILFEIAVIDLHTRLVLNVLSYPAAVLAIGCSGFWSGIGVTSSLLGGIGALVVFLIIEMVGRGAMGRGDTKLAAVIGFMRGFPSVWQALFVGIVTGGFFAAGLLLAGRSRRTTFAYGPALAVGALISMLVTPR
jgi:prepilin signal peptidase PulO-like enzyme (type II secretory pathway)